MKISMGKHRGSPLRNKNFWKSCHWTKNNAPLKHKITLAKDILIIKDLFEHKKRKTFQKQRSKNSKHLNFLVKMFDEPNDIQGSIKFFVMFSYCKSSSRRGTNTDAEFWNTSKRLRMNVLLTKNNLKASEKLNSNEILFKI